MKTPSEIVKEYYPTATPVNIGCKNGNYYNIVAENNILGKGKTKKAAWKSSMRNLNN